MQSEQLSSLAGGGLGKAAVLGGTQVFKLTIAEHVLLETCQLALESWVQIPTLSFPGYRTSGKCFISLHLSFLIYKMKMMAHPFQDYCEEK